MNSHSVFRWTDDAPRLDSFETSHAYYWFRGGQPAYNRPVIVCLYKGSGINTGPSGETPPWQELNADFPGFAPNLWRPHWPNGEWAGPIPEPLV